MRALTRFPVRPTWGPTYTQGLVFIVSTSKLQRQVSTLLSTHLGQFTIRENYRPDWLSTQHGRLELDFYIEELETAVEVQGQQHYVYTPHFHGDENGFAAQLERDTAKTLVCRRRGIKLIEIDNFDEASEVIQGLAGFEYHYTTHPNSIEQAQDSYYILGNGRIGGSRTVRKHLKRIRKIIRKAKGEPITGKDRAKLNRSLTSLRQYEQSKRC